MKAIVTVVVDFAVILILVMLPYAVFFAYYISHQPKFQDPGKGAMWGSSMLSYFMLYQMATFNCWGETVCLTIQDEPWVVIVFVSYILVVGFIITDIFITTVGKTYKMVTEEFEREQQKSQQEYNELIQKQEKKVTPELEAAGKWQP